MSRVLLRATALALVAGVACRSHELVTGVSDSTFVGVMADLRKVAFTPGLDSSLRTVKRDSVLKVYGVSPQQLEAAARRLSGQPDRAHDLWEAIDKRAQPDTTTRPK